MHADLHGMFHREMCHICIAFKRAENDCELVHISRIITEQAKNIYNFLTVSRPTPFSFSTHYLIFGFFDDSSK